LLLEHSKLSIRFCNHQIALQQTLFCLDLLISSQFLSCELICTTRVVLHRTITVANIFLKSVQKCDMTEIYLELPLPPSVNSYWGFSGSRRFLTLQAREFKVQVAQQVSQQPIRFGDQRLSLTVTLCFKDKRRADIDNRIKSLLDALMQAGLFNDDSQIDELHVYRGLIQKQGLSLVKICQLCNN